MPISPNSRRWLGSTLPTLALTACNLPAAAGRGVTATSARSTAPPRLPTTVVPTATLATPVTPTATPVPSSPTPRPPSLTPRPTAIDLFSFPSVHWMGRISLTQGWVRSGGLWWTEDAGASWTEITPAGLSNCPPPDVCSILSPPEFLDPARGRIIVMRGQELVPPTTLSYMYTENGGRTWDLRHIAELDDPLLCPGSACIGSAHLELIDSDHGWLAAYAPLGNISDAAYLYRTRDAGQNWETFMATGLAGAGLIDIQFVSDSEGWGLGLICDRNIGCTQPIYATHNGGRSWQLMEPRLAQ